MKKEELYETLESIDEKYIDEAEKIQLKKKQPVWMKWTVAAACLCLIIVGAVQLKQLNNDNTAVQQCCFPRAACRGYALSA